MHQHVILTLVTCSLLCFNVNMAAPEEDRIVHFPGIPKNMKHLKMYSGYLNPGTPRRLFYFFQMSEKSAPSDPLILWLQGGAICSGIMGSTWHGAFTYAYSKLWKPGVVTNPYRWTRVASMLYMEAAAGVGYSYATDGNDTSNDVQVAKDGHGALKDFFRKFPEFTKNKFYLFGESAGGMAVTALGSLISDDPAINFKGFGTFSGTFVDYTKGDLIEYLYYHGIIGTERKQRLARSCCPGYDLQYNRTCFVEDVMITDPSCNREMLSLTEYSFFEPIDWNDIYGRCNSLLPLLIPKGAVINVTLDFLDLLSVKCYGLSPGGEMTAVMAYMTQPEVQRAMHVRNVPSKWLSCTVLPRYSVTYTSTKQKTDIREMINKGIRAVMLNGDADLVVFSTMAQRFVEDLGFEPEGQYREWYVPTDDGTDQIGGFTQAYQHGVSFAIIKGSGHMVVIKQPASILQVVTKFINDEPL